MSGTYFRGQVVVLEGQFTRTDNDAGQDPDEKTMQLIAPDGTRSDVTVSLLAGDPAGDWRATFTAEQSGVYQYRIESDNPVAVVVGSVYVSPDDFEEDGS